MFEIKKKYYVVWRGINPGIYDSWSECQKQVEYAENALYKSFPSYEEAKIAYEKGPFAYIGKKKQTNTTPATEIILPSISVDAACSGNPGKMEYQGVDTSNKKQLFHQGPFEDGTNNIGEFLALVHGLSYLQKHGHDNIPIYTDSATALSWLKNKKAKTKLELTEKNGILFELIERAEKWLQQNTFKNPILKWDTKKWGEIPADFGRK